MSEARVELRHTDDLDQPWHVVVIAANNEVILTSENYHNKGDAEKLALREADMRSWKYVDTTADAAAPAS